MQTSLVVKVSFFFSVDRRKKLKYFFSVDRRKKVEMSVTIFICQNLDWQKMLLMRKQQKRHNQTKLAKSSSKNVDAITLPLPL